MEPEEEREIERRLMTMAPNPNRDRITDEMWCFWGEFHALEPSVRLGGIFADKSGYHNAREANADSNYSVRETEDRTGPAWKAAAIDLTFPDAQGGNYTTIAKYCKRLMASSVDPNDPRLDSWREWYGQTDSDSQVEGYDTRHNVLVSSDRSHLWHIHMSKDRNSVADWTGYDNALSVLRGESLQAWRDRTSPAPKPPVVVPKHRPGSRTLRLATPNMTGEDVVFVQRWIGPVHVGPADGVFGRRTHDGVRWYQRLRGIRVDGEVGPQTWRQMGVK